MCLLFIGATCLSSLPSAFYSCPQSEKRQVPQRQSILPWNVKQTRGTDYLFAINVYSLWCEQAYQAVCVCVSGLHVGGWLSLCTYVQIYMTACSYGGGRVGLFKWAVHWGRAVWIMAAASYGDLISRQRRHNLSSQPDQRLFFRWACWSVGTLGC